MHACVSHDDQMEQIKWWTDCSLISHLGNNIQPPAHVEKPGKIKLFTF